MGQDENEDVGVSSVTNGDILVCTSEEGYFRAGDERTCNGRSKEYIHFERDDKWYLLADFKFDCYRIKKGAGDKTGKFKVQAVRILEDSYTIAVTSPSGKVWHQRAGLWYTERRARNRVERLQRRLDSGLKLESPDDWIPRIVFTRANGSKYDKGYATCRACERMLNGYHHAYGHGATHPFTGKSAVINQYGGFCCDEECDKDVTQRMESSMPSAGPARRR